MKSTLLCMAAAATVFASDAFAADATTNTPTQVQGAVTVETAPAAVAASVAPAPLFVKPVFLRGTVGETNIQVNIRPKENIDEGLEGEYFIFGHSPKILLAGEMEGNTLFMEESENGTDISGQWDGKLDGDTLTGTWMSADGLMTKPFSLKVISNKQATSATGRVKKTFANPKK